jgi:archaellum component FlaC
VVIPLLGPNYLLAQTDPQQLLGDAKRTLAQHASGWDTGLQRASQMVKQEREILNQVIKDVSQITVEGQDVARRLQIEKKQLDLIRTLVDTKSGPIIEDLKAMYQNEQGAADASYQKHLASVQAKFKEVEDTINSVKDELKKLEPGYNDSVNKMGSGMLSVALKTQVSPQSVSLWLMGIDTGWFGIAGLQGDLTRLTILHKK